MDMSAPPLPPVFPPEEESYCGFRIPSGGYTVFKIEAVFLGTSVLFTILTFFSKTDFGEAFGNIISVALVSVSLYYLRRGLLEGKPNYFLPYIVGKIVQAVITGIMLVALMLTFAVVEGVSSLDQKSLDALQDKDSNKQRGNHTKSTKETETEGHIDAADMKAMWAIGKPFLMLFLIFGIVYFAFSVVLIAVTFRCRAYHKREIYNRIAGEMGIPPQPYNRDNTPLTQHNLDKGYQTQPVVFDQLR